MKYKKNFQATQNPCWQRIRGRAGLTQTLHRRGREGQGLLLQRVLFFSRSGCWENPTSPSLSPLPAHPAPPPHPWMWEHGQGRGEGHRTPGAVLEKLQLQGLPAGVTASSIPKNRGVVLFWHRPPPHPARRGKPMGNTLDVPRERSPSRSGSALALGWLSGCPQQPQPWAAGHSPVSFSCYQNSKEQGSALSPLICSAASAKLPAVPHPAVDEGSRSF